MGIKLKEIATYSNFIIAWLHWFNPQSVTQEIYYLIIWVINRKVSTWCSTQSTSSCGKQIHHHPVIIFSYPPLSAHDDNSKHEVVIRALSDSPCKHKSQWPLLSSQWMSEIIRGKCILQVLPACRCHNSSRQGCLRIPLTSTNDALLFIICLCHSIFNNRASVVFWLHILDL